MIEFSKHSGIYTLEVQQHLKTDMQTTWKFFSSPGNLSVITPAHMGFIITSKHIEKMFPGQIISYKVSPFKGIKLNWITEITHVQENRFFVDEQRFGPYAMWHHEHWFEKSNLGIKMTDRVSYKPPFGFIGRISEPLIIRNQLKKIFNYRYKKLEEIFNTETAS